MTSIADLELAFNNTERLVRGVRPDQWGAASPCAGWTLRDLVNHITWVIEMLGAAARGEAPPHSPTDDVLGADPVAAYTRATQSTLAAWKERGTAGTVQLPTRELPAEVAFNINVIDPFVHGWDIAECTGQEADLDSELCADMLAFAEIIAAPGSRTDNFGPVVDVDADAPVADRLVAYLGRTP
jgi:uncharacterized protein (TIGR03086 family)